MVLYICSTLQHISTIHGPVHLFNPTTHIYDTWSCIFVQPYNTFTIHGPVYLFNPTKHIYDTWSCTFVQPYNTYSCTFVQSCDTCLVHLLGLTIKCRCTFCTILTLCDTTSDSVKIYHITVHSFACMFGRTAHVIHVVAVCFVIYSSFPSQKYLLTERPWTQSSEDPAVFLIIKYILGNNAGNSALKYSYRRSSCPSIAFASADLQIKLFSLL